MLKPGEIIRTTNNHAYRVLRVLGVGGQGIAYEAEGSTGLVVPKIYHPKLVTPAWQKRVEWLVAQQLHTKSAVLIAPKSLLASAHGCGVLMPKVEGMSLEELFEAGRGSFLDYLGIAIAFLVGVVVLEKRSITHGDIAASNVMVSIVDGVFQARLIDFDNYASAHVPPPAFTGQQLYEAPELVSGTISPSSTSDRFALAILLYELLLRRHPFSSLNNALQANSLLKEIEYVQATNHGIWPEDPRLGPSDLKPSVTILPSVVHDLFRRAFGTIPALRPSAEEWLIVLSPYLDAVHRCSKCREMFLNDANRSRCPACGQRPPKLELALRTGERIVLDPLPLTVGRESLGGDRVISTEHAVFSRVGMELRVRDTSRNGTMVRGSRGWRMLSRGDETAIDCGDHIVFASGIEGSVREVR